MSFTVFIEPPAYVEIEEAYLFIRQDSPGNADRWFNGLRKAIDSLEQMPRRCPLAPENSAFEEEIRHLIHGSYRILFTIDEQEVHVLHVRHGARQHLKP